MEKIRLKLPALGSADPGAFTLCIGCERYVILVVYVLITDITVGWLVINVWHNAQYMLFVWMFNNRRFSAVAGAKALLMSRLSQDGKRGMAVSGAAGVPHLSRDQFPPLRGRRDHLAQRACEKRPAGRLSLVARRPQQRSRPAILGGFFRSGASRGV